MAIFYERTETEDEIIIRYKYWALFYIFIIITFALYFIVGSRWIILITPFVMLFIIDFWRPNQEIRKAMKEGNVQVLGSRFSFSNPFTAIIKKGEVT